jgi:hypothetical protein
MRRLRTITNRLGNYHFGNTEMSGFYNVAPSLANPTFTPRPSLSLLANETDALSTASSNAVAASNGRSIRPSSLFASKPPFVDQVRAACGRGWVITCYATKDPVLWGLPRRRGCQLDYLTTFRLRLWAAANRGKCPES